MANQSGIGRDEERTLTLTDGEGNRETNDFLVIEEKMRNENGQWSPMRQRSVYVQKLKLQMKNVIDQQKALTTRNETEEFLSFKKVEIHSGKEELILPM